MEDFETLMNFSSRRNFIEQQILVWLDNPVVDFDNDPDDLDDFSVEFRTLLSVDGKVNIDNEVIDLISTNYFRDGFECLPYKKEKDFKTYNNGRNQFKFKVVFNALKFPIEIHMKSQVVNFKKNRRGRWDRARTKLFVQVSGYVRDSECNVPQFVSRTNYHRRRSSLDVQIRWWFPDNYMLISSREVSGFTWVGGSSNNMILFLEWN